MNIWEAYCNANFYNIYFNILVAKGMSREEVEKIKYLYIIYKQRINDSRFREELKDIEEPLLFLDKLHEIFEDKWKNHLKYKEIKKYFYEYLKFLDSMQALHNDYINDREKERLIQVDTYRIGNLSEYETEYMRDGKLVALMNPTLLSILRERINEDGLATKRAPQICKYFYGKLVNMSISDYATLINMLWDTSRRVKGGGRHKRFCITFSDGERKVLGTFEALKEIILFYGFNEVRAKKTLLRGEPLVVNYVNVGKEKYYDSIGENMYIYNQGNTEDRLNIARAINSMFGNKLKIEMENK